MRTTSSYRVVVASILVIVGMRVWDGLAAAPAAQNASGVALVGCLVEETEYANAHGLARVASERGATQLVILTDTPGAGAAPAGRGAIAYALTGPQENALIADLHRRVSLEGAVEHGAVLSLSEPPTAESDAELTPTGAVGVTADGSPAHEPSDNGARGRGTVAQPASDRPASMSELDRINVTSARVLDGRCDPLRVDPIVADVRRPDSNVETAARRPIAASIAPAESTIGGCLERRDVNGTSALTLLVTPRDDRTVFTRGAVPGSLPSGTGSGTVGTFGSSADGAREAVPYLLVGNETAVARYVGQRVDVVGVADPKDARPGDRPAASADRATPAEPASLETAHPSATLRSFRVTSIRATGGTCR